MGDVTRFIWSTDFLEQVDKKDDVNYSSRLYLYPDDKIEIYYPDFDELQFPQGYEDYPTFKKIN